MGDPGLQTVWVTLGAPGATRSADREALLTTVTHVTGADRTAVRGGRRCATCGADDHGRPWATAANRAVGVSLARTTGVLVLAVGPAPLGVDVERPSRVTAAALDAFTDGERDRSGDDAALLTGCWAVKEAVLKRDGRGLRVDPRRVEVFLGPEGDHAVLAGHSEPVTVLRPADDLVLAVAAGGAPVHLDVACEAVVPCELPDTVRGL